MSDLSITTNSLTTTSTNTNKQNSESTNNDQQNTLIAKANILGIDVSAFYTSDAQTGTASLDIQKLSVAIQEATKQKIKNLNSENDSFVKTTDGSIYTKEEAATTAQIEKNSIKSDYNSDIKYFKAIDSDDIFTKKEAELSDKWDKIKSQANDLTSVTASNTTILEGAKEFIKNLTSLVKETKQFDNTEDDSSENSITNNNFFAEDKSINVFSNEEDYNTFGNNPFFESAFKTFDYEEEEEAV